MTMEEQIRDFVISLSAPEKAVEVDTVVYLIVSDEVSNLETCGPYADPQVDDYYTELEILARYNNYAQKVLGVVDELVPRLVNKYVYESRPTREQICSAVHAAVAAAEPPRPLWRLVAAE